MTQAAHLTAVLVLYGQSPAQSAAFCSLLEAIGNRTDVAQRISLVIYDNSPQPHELPSIPLAAHYIHDVSNGGLACAYNAGLARAKADGSTWLLLLDQDTRLSHEYLAELLDAVDSVQSQAQIAAIVPKLWAGTRLYSPSAPFFRLIRRQFSDKPDAVEEHVTGVAESPLTAYNSGAALRVSALENIGGFPEDFWLDYLDHAVFEQLHLRGYGLWVMHTVLQQNLSHIEIDSVPMWRHWSVLAAQTRFVLRFGDTADRLFFRWWLLKTSRDYRNHCKDKRVWRMRAAQAFRLRPMPPRYPEGHRA
ncbi:MAG: glycosyltransferase [Acidobacteriaceae bacterium]